MRLSFLKYFAWGLLGLSLQTHGINFSADFFVLTLAFAFPALGLGSALILGLMLSIFYGAHSVSPWAAWWLPAGLVLGLLRFWNSYRMWPLWVQRAVAVTLLIAGQWAWVAAWGGGISVALWGFVQTWIGTMVFGILLLPLCHGVLGRIARRVPRPRPRMDELPLYWRNMKSSRAPRERRRPFGLERV
jgi:hypothetical protein